jgi:hypothetical protein
MSYLLFSQHRNVDSQRDGGEGLRIQRQGDQDLCADAAAENHIFKSLMNMRTGNKVGAFFPITGTTSTETLPGFFLFFPRV